MSFIKRSGNVDGKIIEIIDPSDLTEDQKKSVKKISSDSDQTDSSKQQKKSGS